jgi:hypothetical protein
MTAAATIHLRNGSLPILRSDIKRGDQQHTLDHNSALPLGQPQPTLLSDIAASSAGQLAAHPPRTDVTDLFRYRYLSCYDGLREGGA